MILTDQYSGTQWVVGKGISTTTVTAPDVVVPHGTGIVIKGTVLDQSLAQPNTPCVSTQSMELQMEYLHMQMPKDGLWHNETMTGVQVALTALDSNGNYEDLGTVTTDGYYGTFSKTWTPPIAGDYKVIASFAGDDSYGSSSAATSVSVSLAPSASPTVTTATAVASEITMPILTYVVAAIIVIVIAIAIVGALILRSLRKR